MFASTQLKFRIFITVSLILVFSGAKAIAADYAHEITAKKMTFAWTINGANVDIKISAKTTGWVAVGFNPTKKMKDANIIIGYVKDGKVVISDEFGSKMTGHSGDGTGGGQDNISNRAGTEESGVTTLSFTIPLNSGDPKDGVIVANGDTKILLAYGNRDSFRPRHTFRTSRVINLSTGAVR